MTRIPSSYLVFGTRVPHYNFTQDEIRILQALADHGSCIRTPHVVAHVDDHLPGGVEIALTREGREVGRRLPPLVHLLRVLERAMLDARATRPRS